MRQDNTKLNERLENIAQHIPLLGGRLCLDFTNTMEYRGTDRQIDVLPTFTALIRWCEHAGVIPQGTGQAFMTEAGTSAAINTFEQMRSLRDMIFQIFVSRAQEQPIPAETLQTFNFSLEQVLAHRYITIGPDGPTWTWRSSNIPDQVLWPIAYSAAELLTSPELNRVRQCGGCGWLFLDESRNGNRTWCDMRFCGNRAKARRHYERSKQL